MRVIRLLLTGDEGGGIYSNNQPENTRYLRLDYYVMTPLLLSRWNPYNTGVTCTNRPLTNRGGGGNHGVPCPRFRVLHCQCAVLLGIGITGYLALCSGPTGCPSSVWLPGPPHCQCAVLLGIGSPFARLELDDYVSVEVWTNSGIELEESMRVR